MNIQRSRQLIRMMLVSGILGCMMPQALKADFWEYWFGKKNAPVQKTQAPVQSTQPQVHRKNRKVTAPKKDQRKKVADRPKAPREKSLCNWLTMHRTAEHAGYYDAYVADHVFQDTFKKAAIYQAPTWPFFARPFLQKDLFDATLDLGFADKALYGSRTKDISALVFGKETIQLQDILMVSRLLAAGSLEIRGGADGIANVYRVYAPQELRFKTSFNSQQFNINYARHFWAGNLVCGLQVPLVRRSNRINMTIPRDATLDAAYNALGANAKNAFISQYPDGLPDFVADVLQRKNLTLNRANSDIGFGDITLFFNAMYQSRFCAGSTFGVQVVVPVGKTRDPNKIWAPDLGNGGYAQLAAHLGFQWHSNMTWWNPHLYTRLMYTFMGSVDRRVPAVRDYEGVNPGRALAPRYTVALGNPEAIGYMLYGEDVNFIPARHFTEPDSTVREFADRAMRVRIRPGLEWGFKVGNVFEHVFCRRMFIDLFYEFALKAKDSLGFHRDDELLDRSILTKNTATQAHIFGGTWNYQIDDAFRFGIGGQYLFAGRNRLKTASIDLNLSVEF